MQVESEFEKDDRHASHGNIDAHSSIQAERTENISLHIEMETNAHCSTTVCFATFAKTKDWNLARFCVKKKLNDVKFFAMCFRKIPVPILGEILCERNDSQSGWSQ